MTVLVMFCVVVLDRESRGWWLGNFLSSPLSYTSQGAPLTYPSSCLSLKASPSNIPFCYLSLKISSNISFRCLSLKATSEHILALTASYSNISIRCLSLRVPSRVDIGNVSTAG